MTSPLTWNLHANDQLSGVLEKLERTVSGLERTMRGAAGEARSYGRALSDAEGPGARFRSSTQQTEGHLDGLMAKLGGVAAMLRTVAVTGAVALGTAAVAAASFGVKMAAANEEAAISFELMLGSAEKAKDFLTKLQEFAAATPFEMPQLRSAASRLLAVGVSAERIIPILTVLGDATAGMGTGAFGIERAVTALTQMQQKTKVTGEEMMQLTEAGIPAWETLASKLGVDVATAMDMVTKREVDAGVIFDAVQERQGAGLSRLTGMMQRQSTTLTGLWSTFKDNAGQALATFMEPAMPGIKKLLDFTAQAVPQVLTTIQTMVGQVKEIFKDSDVPERIMNSLRTLAERLLPVLHQAWDKIVKTISDNREGLEKLGRLLADVVIPFVGTYLINAITAVTTAIVIVTAGLGHLVDALEWLTRKWLDAMGWMLDAAVKAFGWIPGLGDKLRDAQEHFNEFRDRVLDALNAIDGKTVDVYINTHSYGLHGEHGGSGVDDGSTDISYGGGAPGGQFQEFAGGGMVSGPMGSPQWALVHGGETVRTPEQERALGAGGQILGYLRVVHETPDGRLIREELLALKRTGGLSSLGLA